jgi:hypothetical protein
LCINCRKRNDDVSTDAVESSFEVPPQLFSTDFDSDSDGFSNIGELERGSEPTSVSEDFDGDGIANDSDSDYDNNGIPDDQDNSVAGIPFTITPPVIDGAFGWWEWQQAARSDSRGNYLRIDHLVDDP